MYLPIRTSCHSPARIWPSPAEEGEEGVPVGNGEGAPLPQGFSSDLPGRVPGVLPRLLLNADPHHLWSCLITWHTVTSQVLYAVVHGLLEGTTTSNQSF